MAKRKQQPALLTAEEMEAAPALLKRKEGRREYLPGVGKVCLE